MRPVVHMRETGFKTLHLGVEMGQMLFRLFSALLFVLYLAGMQVFGVRRVDVDLVLLAIVFVASAAAGVAIVRLSLLKFKNRLRVAIIVDQILLALALYAGGDLMAPVLWAPIGVALGCGLLGGASYAKAASAFGATLMAVAFTLSPFWSAVPLISTGIVLATILIPWHWALLAEQIIDSRNEMRRRAAAFEAASKMDSLTGVLNRAGFLGELDDYHRKTAGRGIKGALLLLDLDGFKAVNDVGGHALGDSLLKEVAQRLRQCLRASDCIGRLGGDEFGILACNLGGEQDAEWLAYKVLHTIEAIRLPGHGELQVTGSIGIRVLPAPQEMQIAELLEEADRLMYEAKKAGKNQYRTSFEPTLQSQQA